MIGAWRQQRRRVQELIQRVLDSERQERSHRHALQFALSQFRARFAIGFWTSVAAAFLSLRTWRNHGDRGNLLSRILAWAWIIGRSQPLARKLSQWAFPRLRRLDSSRRPIVEQGA